MQDGQTVDAGGYTFTNQTVYALNLTLTSYLANGGKYTVTVLYNGVDGFQRNATSNEVQVRLYSQKGVAGHIHRSTHILADAPRTLHLLDLVLCPA